MHPANKLGRQAAEMGWVAAGVRKVDRGRNIQYRQGDLLTEVSFSEEKVYLLDGDPELWVSFKDYEEFEKWLEGDVPRRSPDR